MYSYRMSADHGGGAAAVVAAPVVAVAAAADAITANATAGACVNFGVLFLLLLLLYFGKPRPYSIHAV